MAKIFRARFARKCLSTPLPQILGTPLISSTIIIVTLIRSKAKLQKELETLMGNTKIIYDEVNNHPSPSLTLNTQENSAYGVSK